MHIYIKEMKKNEELIKNINIPNCLKKIIIKVKKMFNIVTIKKIKNLHYLYIIPKIKNIKLIEKIIEKNKKAKIILSKELKHYEKDLQLKPNNSTIYYFTYNILKYTMEKANKEVELQNIYFLANEYNMRNLQIIKYLLDKVKTVTIVTSNPKKFKQLEEKMYEEDGSLIAVTNSKNKGLKRANYIINLDFDNQTISKYKINRNSIIINCTSDKINSLTYFDGVIINNIEIHKREKIKAFGEEFNEIDLYESFEIKSDKYSENIKKIEEDKVEIINLIGNNGIINTKEIVNVQKKLDK